MYRFKNVEDGQKLLLEGKRIDIMNEDTVQSEYAFSNNDASCKHIWCWLKDKKNVVIDGGGALLLFHGRITPFLLDNCENICLRNFTIDYARPFFTQGTILYADESCVELKIPREYPYRVEGKNLIIEAESWENNLHDGIMLFQEFDPNRNSLAYDSPVLIYRVGEDAEIDATAPLPMKILTAEETDRGTLCLYGEFPWQYTVGNELIMTHEKRCNPGIGIHNCRNVKLEDIHIVHSGSMGIVAQLGTDIIINRVRVARGSHPERMISTNCDAVHFVACSGRIGIFDCTLEHMMDDGVNVHGVYARVEKLCGKNMIEVQLMHFQHFGVNFYREGDLIEIYCENSVKSRMYRKVKSAYMCKKECIRLEFTEDIEGICEGDFVENLTTTPELYIKGLQTGFNRPRGVLATTPRKVVIEDSIFYNSGYGIHIAGDTQFWYESGAVRDVIIQNNRFVNCGHDMGNFSIAITPEYKMTEESPFYHQNITIRNNQFESFLDGAVYAYGVDGLCVENNTFIKTDLYRKRVETKPIVVRNCRNISSDMEVQHTQELMW